MIEITSAIAEPSNPYFTIRNQVVGNRIANKIIPLIKSNFQKVDVPMMIPFNPVEASIVRATHIKNIVDNAAL